MLVPLAEWARREVEEQADEFLAADRINYTTTMGAYYFNILSESQLEMRREREMLTKSGRFDVAHKPGCYHRAWNLLANTRPTKQRQYSMPQDPWHQHQWDGYESGPMHSWLPSSRREEVTSGENSTIWPTHDPAGATPPGQNYYHHLTRGQRSRIRAIMKAIPSTKPKAREAVKKSMSEHYGAPTWVIARVCL
jgi:hypothetical protein